MPCLSITTAASSYLSLASLRRKQGRQKGGGVCKWQPEEETWSFQSSRTLNPCNRSQLRPCRASGSGCHDAMLGAPPHLSDSDWWPSGTVESTVTVAPHPPSESELLSLLPLQPFNAPVPNQVPHRLCIASLTSATAGPPRAPVGSALPPQIRFDVPLGDRALHPSCSSAKKSESLPTRNDMPW